MSPSIDDSLIASACGKQKRDQRHQMVRERQVQVTEQRIIEFELREKERRERQDARNAEQRRLANESLKQQAESEWRRVAIKQSGILLDLKRRVFLADEGERTQQRVDFYMLNKGTRKAMQQLEEVAKVERKRKQVYETAKQHEQACRDSVQKKQEQFEGRYQELLGNREFRHYIQSEELHLKALDKAEQKERSQNIAEFEKLLLIDNLHRKTEQIDRANLYKASVQKVIRQEYDAKQRFRQQVAADMDTDEVRFRKKITTVLHRPIGALDHNLQRSCNR